MKTATWVLVTVSLLANGVLAFFVVRSGRQAAQAETVAAEAKEGAMVAARATAAARSAAEAARTEATEPVWTKLASDDLAALAGNLKAAGFPDRFARAVVAAALSERYDARRKALLGEEKPPPFWQTRNVAVEPAKLAELRTLAREQQDQLKRLFGPDPRSDEARHFLRRIYGDLPAEKLELVQRIQSDYSDMQRQIRAEAGGLLLPEDRENLAFMEKEKRKDLAAVLTPQEMDTLDLAGSPTANAMRARLGAFAPSEAEFRAVFGLQRDFDERFNNSSANFNDPETLRERRAAEQELNNRIRAALGDARYEDFRRAQDPGFRLASRIIERAQLPTENALAVYQLQRDVQQRAAAVRSDPAALGALAEETEAKLALLLGVQGGEVYKRQAGWLWALQRGGRGTVPTRPPAGPPGG